MDYLPVGIILADGDNEIKHVNKEISQTILYKSKEASVCSEVGWTQDQTGCPSLSLMDFIKDRNNPEVTLENIMNSKKLDESKIYSMISEETKKVYEVSIKSLPDVWPEGYRILLLKDQTLYEQLVREKMMERYQRMLLSSISHEIRNPLNAINGYISMIGDEGEETPALCKNIECAVKQIDFIVTGACELMTNQDRAPIIKVEPFPLVESIRKVKETTMPFVHERAVTMRMTIPPKVPEVIYSDCKKYSMILFNLLMNAVKYTNTGVITIQIDYNEATDILHTSVQDTGCGISEERLDKLFELYANIENVNPYNPQGMGLGLTLCKKLSRALGGDIRATSSLEVGSNFTFWIKCNSGLLDCSARTDEIPFEINIDQDIRVFIPRVPRIKKPKGSAHCICPKALIVDDEPTNRLVIKSYLNSIKIEAEEANNGKIAVDMVTNRLHASDCCSTYSLILMDINMPVMDGTCATEMLIQLFKENGIEKTPIIAVTAANMQTRADMQGLLSIGFVDISICFIFNYVVQKPVSKAQFIDRVKYYLSY